MYPYFSPIKTVVPHFQRVSAAPCFGHIGQPKHVEIATDQRLLIDSPGFSQNLGWARVMELNIRTMVKRWDRLKTFDRLLSGVASRYQAYFQTQPQVAHYELFGKPKPLDATSLYRGLIAVSASNRYASYVKRLQSLLPPASQDNAPLQDSILPPKNRNLEVTVALPGEPRPLKLMTIWQHREVMRISQHTFTKAESDRLGAHLNSLYQTLRQLPSTRRNMPTLIETLGQLHWWMVVTRPFYRGTAGISDVVTKVIADAKGIRTTRWRPGCIPDLEAFAIPDPVAYGRQYHTFFTRDLLHLNEA